MQDKPMSILKHLEELRRVLIISLISVIPGAAVGWFVREDILRILVKPVNDLHYKLVYIGTTEAFSVELSVAFTAGVIFASPVIAYQFWRFVLPALHAHEKRYIMIFVPVSLALFAGGVVFAYYTVFIYAIQFFLSFGDGGLNPFLTPMLSLSRYLSFTMWFLVPFGLIFELPLLILLMARLGIITPAFLAGKRRWAFLLAFIFAGIITPTTDMFTQSVMGLAVYFLYEASIWLSYLVRPKKSFQIATAGGPSDNEAESAGDSFAADWEEKEPEHSSDLGAENVEDIYRHIVDRGKTDNNK